MISLIADPEFLSRIILYLVNDANLRFATIYVQLFLFEFPFFSSINRLIFSKWMIKKGWKLRWVTFIEFPNVPASFRNAYYKLNWCKFRPGWGIGSPRGTTRLQKLVIKKGWIQAALPQGPHRVTHPVDRLSRGRQNHFSKAWRGLSISEFS